MKQYTITLHYQDPNRDMYGFPQFGEQTVEILSTSINYVYTKLNQLFGKDNYSIITIEESIVDKTDLSR